MQVNSLEVESNEAIPVANIIQSQPMQVKSPGAWKGLVQYSAQWNSA